MNRSNRHFARKNGNFNRGRASLHDKSCGSDGATSRAHTSHCGAPVTQDVCLRSTHPCCLRLCTACHRPRRHRHTPAHPFSARIPQLPACPCTRHATCDRAAKRPPCARNHASWPPALVGNSAAGKMRLLVSAGLAPPRCRVE